MDYNINTFGRSYRRGPPLSDDLRSLIIDEITKEGGDTLSGYIPVTYTTIANRLSVTVPLTVKKIWKQFCEENNLAVKDRGGTRNRKLTRNDLELIETLKVAQGSISMREINEI